MEKVVLVFCKIENCYDGNEGYENRKNIMPFFFEKLEKIRKINSADTILFSFFTNQDYDVYYIKPTEININLKDKTTCIKVSNQFYKNESHVFNYYKNVEDCYEIRKHVGSKTMDLEILEYIDKSYSMYDVKNIIFITDNDLSPEYDNYDKIVAIAGFQNLVLSLDHYIEEKSTKIYTYAKVV